MNHAPVEPIYEGNHTRQGLLFFLGKVRTTLHPIPNMAIYQLSMRRSPVLICHWMKTPTQVHKTADHQGILVIAHLPFYYQRILKLPGRAI
jgi:hypothetical protein